MNRISAFIGVILVIIAAFLFYITFNSGMFGPFTITGTNATADFAAMLFVIVALPVGAGLAFAGFAYRRPFLAVGTQQQVVYKGSSGLSKAALAIAIIAILIALGAFGTLLSTNGSLTTNQSSFQSSVNSQLAALNGKLGTSAVNATPGQKIPYRIDWANNDPTGQDRFNPPIIVVTQGAIVQIMFEHNDSDAHTFTMYTATTPYGFQINDTTVGMHNFLTNGNFSSACANGTYTQDTTGLTANGVSTVYCVSGTSLLSPSVAGTFKAINPLPKSPFGTGTNNTGPILVGVTNQVFAVAPANQTAGFSETWGIGAFRATTPGVFQFFCDYHVSNGMFGYLVVLPNSLCTGSACTSSNSTSTT